MFVQKFDLSSGIPVALCRITTHPVLFARSDFVSVRLLNEPFLVLQRKQSITEIIRSNEQFYENCADSKSPEAAKFELEIVFQKAHSLSVDSVDLDSNSRTLDVTFFSVVSNGFETEAQTLSLGCSQVNGPQIIYTDLSTRRNFSLNMAYSRIGKLLLSINLDTFSLQYQLTQHPKYSKSIKVT